MAAKFRILMGRDAPAAVANRALFGLGMVALAGALLCPAALAATPGRSGPPHQLPAREFPAPVAIVGSVHGSDGAPIEGAFIQVADGVSSAVTDVNGRFDLLAEPHEGHTLIVTAVGYQTAEIPISRAGSIELQALPSYRPVEVPPPLPTAPAAATVFDTEISGAYRTRYQSFAATGRGVLGWANNEFGVDARYRAGDWVLGLDGYRNRVPFSIEGLSPQLATAPEVEDSAWNLSAGRVFSLAGLEFLPKLVFSNSYSVPSGTGGTPWTGTPLDFNQTRLAGDVALDVGYRLGPVTAILHGQRSFVETTTLTGAPYAATDVGQNEVGLDLSYTVIPGLRTDVSVLRSFAVGVPGTSLDQWADVVGLGLTYLPAQVQP